MRNANAPSARFGPVRINAACPAIKVDIQMTLVTPANAKGPVPVLMMFGGFFGGSGLPRRAGDPPPATRPGRGFGAGPGGAPAGPSSTEQLLAAGWGYATITPNSIQADNGAGLTKGIVGLRVDENSEQTGLDISQHRERITG